MLAGIAAPIGLLEQYASQGEYHLALSHLIIDSAVYADFYRRQSQHVLVGVDNGLVEQGRSLPLRAVIDAARRVGAQEIVLPDVLGDGEESLKATRMALEEFHGISSFEEFEVIGVAHGANVYDWMSCYFGLLELPVQVIGISMFDSDLFSGGRVELLDQLEVMDLIDPNKAYHCLGCWKDIREAYGLSTRTRSHEYSYGWYSEPREYVRSMDTGLPVRLGLQGLVAPGLDEIIGPPPATHRKDDFFREVQPSETIQTNVDLYKACCHGNVYYATKRGWNEKRTSG